MNERFKQVVIPSIYLQTRVTLILEYTNSFLSSGLKVKISAFIFEITGTQTYVIIIEQPIHQ